MTDTLVTTPPQSLRGNRSARAIARLAHGPVVTIVDQMLLSAAHLSISLFLARCAAPETLGQYALAFLVVSILGDFHRSAIWQPMTILSGRGDPAASERRYRTTIRLSLGLGVAAATLVLAVAGGVRLFGYEDQTLLWSAVLLAPVLVASVAHEIQRRVNLSLGRSTRTLFSDAAYAGVVAGTLSAGFAAHMLWEWNPSTRFGLLALLAGMLMGTLAGRGPIARLDRSEPSPPIREVTARHWPYARWNLAGTTLQFGVDRMAVFVLSFSGGLLAVANFEAGRLLAMPLYVVVMGLYGFLVPALAKQQRLHGSRRMVRVGLQWGLLQLLLAIGFAGVLWLGAEAAGRAVFQRDYEQIATISAAWALIIGSYGVVATAAAVLGLLKMQKWAVLSRVPSAITLLALLLPAIEWGGESAVSMALAGSGLLSGLLAWIAIGVAMRNTRLPETG